jgi:hypothetical protein
MRLSAGDYDSLTDDEDFQYDPSLLYSEYSDSDSDDV